MSEAKPRECSRGCGQLIYFDKDSPIGHPSADKWVPLEIRNGARSGEVHQCPKRNDNGTATIAKPESLAVAETLLQILTDYIRLKTKEQGVAA